MTELIPNVFLIGVQKSATTSLYDWLAQHPDICAPFSMKDTPFFVDDQLYNKGLSFLGEVYKKQYNGQHVILNGNANIIYFEKAIKRISHLNPEARLILILRNPVDRAISAYNFAKKRNMESESLKAAIERESEWIKDGDLRYLSNNTYVDHGKYYTQLIRLFKYFKRDHVLILIYEDLISDPEAIIKKTYAFVGVDKNFCPEFKNLNPTGGVRFAWIRNTIYSQSRIKKFIVKYLLDFWVPYDLKYRAKIFFLNLITKNKKTDSKIEDIDMETVKLLKGKFINEIEELEKLLGRRLDIWKH